MHDNDNVIRRLEHVTLDPENEEVVEATLRLYRGGTETVLLIRESGWTKEKKETYTVHIVPGDVVLVGQTHADIRILFGIGESWYQQVLIGAQESEDLLELFPEVVVRYKRLRDIRK